MCGTNVPKAPKATSGNPLGIPTVQLISTKYGSKSSRFLWRCRSHWLPKYARCLPSIHFVIEHQNISFMGEGAGELCFAHCYQYLDSGYIYYVLLKLV